MYPIFRRIDLTKNLMKKFLSTEKPKISGRFTTIPVDLFRIETAAKINLREKTKQQLKNSMSYDYTVAADGLIHAAIGDFFIGPNGLSLRPAEVNNWDIISSYKGKFKIVCLPKGLKLPTELILLHERGDHYSLQTAISCPIEDLNKRMTELLKPLERMTKEDYFKRYPLY